MLAAHVPRAAAPAPGAAARRTRTCRAPWRFRATARAGRRAGSRCAPTSPRRPRTDAWRCACSRATRAGEMHRARAGQHDAGHGGRGHARSWCGAATDFILARFGGARAAPEPPGAGPGHAPDRAARRDRGGRHEIRSDQVTARRATRTGRRRGWKSNNAAAGGAGRGAGRGPAGDGGRDAERAARAHGRRARAQPGDAARGLRAS